ncbi:hypothetical protein QF050_003757 [Arthrobacter sp. SLBN-112]|nr:hypothetical protein [Arthrobacter sp. SLBN-112]
MSGASPKVNADDVTRRTREPNAVRREVETDPEVSLAELQRQRDGIDAEMQRIRASNIRVMTAPEARDHLQQLTALARDLLRQRQLRTGRVCPSLAYPFPATV